MAKKEYVSLDYYAQEFRKFLPEHLHLKYGGGWAVKQSGNNISFRVSDINCNLEFRLVEGRVYAVLDMKSENKELFAIEKRFKPKRSKTRRISGEFYADFFEGFVLVNLRRYSRNR